MRGIWSLLLLKKPTKFVFFIFGDFQLLDIMNFLGGATSLDSFLKADKTSQTKNFFPYEWFDSPQKMDNSEPSSLRRIFQQTSKREPPRKKIFRISKIV